MLISNVRLLKWNIPRGFLLLQNFDRVNSPSPLGVQIPLPKDFHIHTPPEVVGSQHEATSPVQLSAALVSMGVIERARMFLQGRHNELVKSMNRMEARLVTKSAIVDTMRLIHSYKYPVNLAISILALWLHYSKALGTRTANLECDQLGLFGLAVIFYSFNYKIAQFSRLRNAKPNLKFSWTHWVHV
jgi:hypothetical protein